MKYRLSSDKVAIFSYFISIIAMGAILLLLPVSWKGEKPIGFIDALFTSTSAVCVTGLITVNTALFSRFGQVVIMFLIEAGGLGIIAFTTIYVMLPRRKISLVSRGLVRDYSIDEIAHDPRAIIKVIVLSTLAIETIGALSLWMVFARNKVPAPVFNAIFHAVSAFCNAGFSTFPNNLESWVGDVQLNLSICALIITGGLGFVVIADIGRRALGRKKRIAFYSGTVLRITAVLLAVGFVIFLIMEWNGAYREFKPFTKILAAFFQSVTPRTAGFDTVTQAALAPASLLLVMFFMFVGGSSGSTAGGVKTSTLYILLMLTLKGTDQTNDSLVVRGRAIPLKTIIKAIRIVLKAMLILVASVALVAIFERSRIMDGTVSLVQVIFEVISAFGTVGLSLNLTDSLTGASKLVVIFTMFIGRVGLVTMAMPVPGKSIEKYVDFASADHIVG